MDTQTETAEDLETSLAIARGLIARNRAARAVLEETDEALERYIGKAVDRWDEIEDVPCGHSGGWSLNTTGGIVNDAGEIRLIHECFYAHRYDLHHTYETTVSLDRLLGAFS